MGATLTTVTHITKEVYGPRIVDQLEDETTLAKRIEKTSKGVDSHVGGKYVTFPLRVRRNQGIGYRNELEQLQDAGQQGYQSVRVPLRYGYGRVHISGQTMDLVDANFQAFSSAMTREMEGLKDDLAKDVNRILWGNGKGVLGTVDTATAATNNASLGTNDDAVNWVDLDMQIDILSSDGVTTRVSNRKITAINETTGDITYDGAAGTLSVGDIVVRTGNYGKEPNGLTSLVSDTGVLHNLDPATEPSWKAYVDSAGGSLSELNMVKTCDKLRKKGGKVSAIFADLGTRRAYFSLLKTERRFPNVKEFEGGFSGLAFVYGSREVPVVEDVDAPAGKMWFLDESSFSIKRDKAWSWEDRDGNIWKWVTNYDAYEALMKQYWEFAVEKRNANGVMTGITPA